MKKRDDGRYQSTFSYTDKESGKRKQFVFYGATQAEAKRKRDDAKDRMLNGGPVRDDSRTLGEWCQQWRKTGMRTKAKRETTLATYDSLLIKHVESTELGEVPLNKLDAHEFQQWIIERRGSGLSEASLAKIAMLLHNAIRAAVRAKLLAYDPMDAVELPSEPQAETRVLTVEEVRKLLAKLAGTRYEGITTCIASLGLRKGEALGLQWDDVDLEKRTVSIRRTMTRLNGELVTTEPKTAKSRRTLPLSDSMVALFERQQAQQERDRGEALNLWTDTGYVWTSETGHSLDPRNVLRAVTTAADRAGLEDVTVHSLRHTAATLMITSGMNVKAVSELLGHRDVKVTLQVYTHTSDDVARQALEGLSDALSASV